MPDKFQLAVLILLMSAAPLASAHHAPALYDNDRLIQIRGTVVRLSYRQPHSSLLVDTDKGERWVISLAPPDVTDRQGKKADLMAIQPGESIAVYGWPHRLRDREIRSHKLVFADGRTIDGAVNSLFEPQVQKDLKRLLRDPSRLAEFATEMNADSGVAEWVDRGKPLARLALEISQERARFIGFEDASGFVYPGIKPHLACFPGRFGSQLVKDFSTEADTLAFVSQFNEWLARFREGQLNICEDLE